MARFCCSMRRLMLVATSLRLGVGLSSVNGVMVGNLNEFQGVVSMVTGDIRSNLVGLVQGSEEVGVPSASDREAENKPRRLTSKEKYAKKVLATLHKLFDDVDGEVYLSRVWRLVEGFKTGTMAIEDTLHEPPAATEFEQEKLPSTAANVSWWLDSLSALEMLVLVHLVIDVWVLVVLRYHLCRPTPNADTTVNKDVADPNDIDISIIIDIDIVDPPEVSHPAARTTRKTKVRVQFPRRDGDWIVEKRCESAPVFPRRRKAKEWVPERACKAAAIHPRPTKR